MCVSLNRQDPWREILNINFQRGEAQWLRLRSLSIALIAKTTYGACFLNNNKQKHNTSYAGVGLPKYQDSSVVVHCYQWKMHGTHCTQQVRVLSQWVTNHFRTYCSWNHIMSLSPFFFDYVELHLTSQYSEKGFSFARVHLNYRGINFYTVWFNYKGKKFIIEVSRQLECPAF